MSKMVFRKIDSKNMIWIQDSFILETDQIEMSLLFPNFSGSDLIEVESPLTGNITVLEADEIVERNDESYTVIYRPQSKLEVFELHILNQ